MAEKEFKPGQDFTKEEWDDTEFPEMTDEELAEMRPFAEVFPDLAASIRNKREAEQDPTKRLVSLQLSAK